MRSRPARNNPTQLKRSRTRDANVSKKGKKKAGTEVEIEREMVERERERVHYTGGGGGGRADLGKLECHLRRASMASKKRRDISGLGVLTAHLTPGTPAAAVSSTRKTTLRGTLAER